MFLSVASVWEMAVQAALGRRDPAAVPDRGAFGSEQLAVTGVRVLAAGLEHACGVAALPQFHRDPFERLPIAQAQVEGLTVVSRDTAAADYGAPVLW